MAAEPVVLRRSSGALAVGAGILLSRLSGLVRERAIAHYLGISAGADAFRAALRIPNMLQNLLGEGVLSASFIPVYARLLAAGRPEDASRVARTIGTLLALAASLLALLGVLGARVLVELLAPGFAGPTLDSTTRLVQIMFPGVALLVLSAWCLGVLNSHRRFFLSYVSPVLWNAALIAAAIVAARHVAGHDFEIAEWLAWGAVVGSAAQLLVQLPSVVKLLRGLRPALALRDPDVRTTLGTFGPVLLGRGSVQLSGYIDLVIASYLGRGMVAAISNAQTLYMLPVSLFGMAVSAAELPAMAGTTGDGAARAEQLRERLHGALRRVLFLVVPSAVAFVTIGDSLVRLLFQSGRFGSNATTTVWIILIGSALGLPSATQGRLVASAFYALGAPKPPMQAALIRVAMTALCGFLLALPLRDALGYSATLGAFGLTLSSGLAASVELALLRRGLRAHLGVVPSAFRLGFGALGAALLAGGAGRGAALGATALGCPGWLAAGLAVAVFGMIYLSTMMLAKVPEARGLLRRLQRRGKA